MGNLRIALQHYEDLGKKEKIEAAANVITPPS